MNRRNVFHCVLLAHCAALVGCGGGSDKPATKGPAVKVVTAAQARKDLFEIAKKIEDAAAVESLEFYVSSFEKSFADGADPEKRWTWPDLNEHVLQGSYSLQTKQAYEKWRATNPVRFVTALQARKSLYDIAKKSEDTGTFETLELHIKDFEKGSDPETGSMWPALNEHILQGNYSIDTKQAYEKWRTAKIADDKKR